MTATFGGSGKPSREELAALPDETLHELAASATGKQERRELRWSIRFYHHGNAPAR